MARTYRNSPEWAKECQIPFWRLASDNIAGKSSFLNDLHRYSGVWCYEHVAAKHSKLARRFIRHAERQAVKRAIRQELYNL